MLWFLIGLVCAWIRRSGGISHLARNRRLTNDENETEKTKKNQKKNKKNSRFDLHEKSVFLKRDDTRHYSWRFDAWNDPRLSFCGPERTCKRVKRRVIKFMNFDEFSVLSFSGIFGREINGDSWLHAPRIPPPSFVFPDWGRGRREVAFCASEFRMLVSPALFNSDCLSYQIERFRFVDGYFDRAKRTKIASRWGTRLFMQTRVV